MHTKFWLIDVNQSWKSENTKIVVILLWFLGTCALSFCFAGLIQLVHCDACSTQVKPRRSKVPRYHVSGDKFAVHSFTVSNRVEHTSQRTSCSGPAKQNGSAQVPKNQIEYRYDFGISSLIFRIDWRLTSVIYVYIYILCHVQNTLLSF